MICFFLYFVGFKVVKLLVKTIVTVTQKYPSTGYVYALNHFQYKYIFNIKPAVDMPNPVALLNRLSLIVCYNLIALLDYPLIMTAFLHTRTTPDAQKYLVNTGPHHVCAFDNNHNDVSALIKHMHTLSSHQKQCMRKRKVVQCAIAIDTRAVLLWKFVESHSLETHS